MGAVMNCERCNEKPAVKKEKYCKACRKIVLDELYEAGYLTPRVCIGWSNRGPEKREAIRDTKYGTDR